jgi:integral membrane sensor domain MASE1
MAVRPNAPTPNRFGRLGTVVLVVVLLGLLIAAILFAVRSFTSLEGPPMPEVGYVAMTIGVVFSLLVGITLMTLLFYSSRHGYDEQVSELPRDDDSTPK